MRAQILLASLAVALLAAPSVAAIGTPTGQQGPPLIDFGSPCLNGGVTLVVYGVELFRCWKPLDSNADEPAVKCASEVCSLVNLACTVATKPVTKKDCVLVA